jgi:hypothetical protein
MADKPKKETKTIERNGEKVKVERYEGTTTWRLVK